MQLVLFICMAVGGGVLLIFIGTLILSKMTGISWDEIGNVKKWNLANPKMLFLMRGLTLLQFLGLFLIPSLLMAYLSDPKPGKYLGMRPPWKAGYWILGIAALLIAYPFVEYTGILNYNMLSGHGNSHWVNDKEQEAAKLIQFMLADRSVNNLVINLIFIALFAGIGEELFFRGVIQRLLIRGTKSPWAGILITAFVFAFVHFQFYGFLPRFFLGALLGAIYWYSGSIWTAVLAHFFWDGMTIVIAYLHPETVTSTDASVLEHTKGVEFMAMASLALTVIILMWMKRNSRSSFEAVYADDYRKHPDNPFDFH